MKRVIVTPVEGKEIFWKLDIASREANASGVNIGFQAKTLQFFPMKSQPIEDNFDYTQVDAILTPKEATQFKIDCWFAFKEAQRHGSGLMIDCANRSVGLLAEDFFDDEVIEIASP